MDERGATRRYTHRDGAHAVDIRFSPALPPLGALRDGQQIRYEFWLEDRQKLMDGVIDVAVTASGDVVLHWRHDLPPSMGRVPFRSAIRTRPEGGGYEIDVQPETGGATPP